MVILFLVLSLSTSLLSSGFTFYNSISNPYQTFLGPLGVYTWSGLSGEYTGAGPWPRPQCSLLPVSASLSRTGPVEPCDQEAGGGGAGVIFVYLQH